MGISLIRDYNTIYVFKLYTVQSATFLAWHKMAHCSVIQLCNDLQQNLTANLSTIDILSYRPITHQASSDKKVIKLLIHSAKHWIYRWRYCQGVQNFSYYKVWMLIGAQKVYTLEDHNSGLTTSKLSSLEDMQGNIRIPGLVNSRVN